MYRRRQSDQFSFYRSGTKRSGGARSRGGRYGVQDNRDLSLSFDKMAISRPKRTRVPPLSCFVMGDRAVAGDAITVGGVVPEARTIPDNFDTTTEYLQAMQTHTQLEFAGAVEQGIMTNDRRETQGWFPVTCRTNPARRDDWLRFYVDGQPSAGSDDGHNFREDPWCRHAIQFEGFQYPCLVMICDPGSNDYQAYITVAGAGTYGFPGVPAPSDFFSSHVRSLGYVGTFLREYASAAALVDSSSPLLTAVAAPGYGHSESRGSYVPAPSALDTRSIPVNGSQETAIKSLTGGLDIIVGPPGKVLLDMHARLIEGADTRGDNRALRSPFLGVKAGTGKSTTLWHVINSRVAPHARVLVTCARNQAVEAVTRKVASFGVLVFGNQTRIGPFAAENTVNGRMKNDPELIFWHSVSLHCSKTSRDTSRVAEDLSMYPGLRKLRELQHDGFHGPTIRRTLQERKAFARGQAARRWLLVLKSVLFSNRESRCKALHRWKIFLRAASQRVAEIEARLIRLTRYRILTQTRVLISTIDSTERMLRVITRETLQAEADLADPHGRDEADLEDHHDLGFEKVSVDTVIMDEAACVLETALPVLLKIGAENLTLVGDQHQLRPFSLVRDEGNIINHARSLMERALDAGAPRQFLSTQYRMHPRLCKLISSLFYDNKLTTAHEKLRSRTSSQPCQWIHVSGGEIKHSGRGYSNPTEAERVVYEAAAALDRFGPGVEVRVVTFYNMQKRRLEEAFRDYGDLDQVSIVSVDACQGSDADVVIISTVRSGGIGCKLSGFMLDRKRINVALSRAKQEYIIVGDKHTLGADGDSIWGTVIDHFEA